MLIIKYLEIKKCVLFRFGIHFKKLSNIILNLNKYINIKLNYLVNK